MKVSPLAQGTGVPANSPVNAGNAERIIRAKAIMMGETPEVNAGAVSVETKGPLPTITMKTQQSTNRHELQSAIDPNTQTPENPISDTSEQAPKVEATKPLSPQFAALAKAKRALQVKERELAQREEALKSQGTSNADEILARLKADPLSVLNENGVSYDQLTEAILNGSGSNSEILKLQNEIKALKEDLSKQFETRDQQAEQQVLREIRREADMLTSQGDEFEAIRQARAQSKVVELIHRTWQKTGEVLDVSEAAKLVEEQLIEDALPFVKFKKVQEKLTPQQQVEAQAPAQVNEAAPNTHVKTMRTLTNRDAARPGTSDRRARAIAAFNGTKQR